jgi:diguanylate cyclase
MESRRAADRRISPGRRIGDRAALLPRRALAKIGLNLISSAFVAGICALICIAFVWREKIDYENNILEAEVSSRNLARSLVKHAEDNIRLADVALVDLVERVEADAMAPDKIARLSRSMKKRVESEPYIGGLFIYDAKGAWLASHLDAIPAAVNNSDREYFAYHRDNKGKGVRIGEPVRSKSRGHWVLPISRRVDDQRGNFAGVVLATIGIEALQSHYKQFELGDGGIISLVRSDGLLLGRYPADNAILEKRIVFSDFIEDTGGATGAGFYRYRSIIDGTERIAGYAKEERFGLTVIAALSKAELLSTWRVGLLYRVGFAVVMFVAVGLCGVLLTRKIQHHSGVERAMTVMARTDTLTGLANRRVLEDTLPREWLRAIRTGSPVSLLVIDADHFKRFNDEYGHPEGDRFLQDLARTIANLARRPADLVVRYGGEEFVVLLPDTDEKGSRSLAEMIRHAVETMNFIPKGHTGACSSTVSIGAATARPMSDRPEALSTADLIASADAALYLAKNSGRNRVCSASDLRQSMTAADIFAAA